MKRIVTLLALAALAMGCKGKAESPSEPEIASEPTVEGEMDREAIREGVRAGTPQVKACYESALAKDADLAGTVKVSFTIGRDGAVTSSEVAESTMGDPEMEGCVADVVSKLSFEGRPAGDVQVTYPFVFQPEQG